MKNFCQTILVAIALLTISCSKENNPNPQPDPADSLLVTKKDELAKFWKDKYADDVFTSLDNVKAARYFKNGDYTVNIDARVSSMSDYRYEFYDNNGNVRFVSVADGYGINLPEGTRVDYTLAKYGVKFQGENFRLRITNEVVTPYSQDEYGYSIYTGEWLDRYISNAKYLGNNNLEYFSKTVKNDKTMLPGYDVTIYSIHIKASGDIVYPYYRIAIIRKEGQYATFGLLVYKCNDKHETLFDDIVKSYRYVGRYGVSANYLPEQKPVANPHWNAETKAYYQKMSNFGTLDFGAFSYSMSGDNSGDFDSQHEKIKREKERLEGPSGFNHKYGIMPTYTHIAYYSTKMYFPSKMAAEFAGGNGFDDKPVLQFTYQFTTNNNNVNASNVTSNYTPMFDILRGEYDSDFTELAIAIKNYKKPVLFRLNNEMNTDWTSYCGMITLIDPEIFIETWKHLYDIFEEQGVDNCIWIFNPIHISCPYSFWGEDLAYYPGNEYCQALGLTSYEFNNGVGTEPESFRSHYSKLAKKNSKVFGTLPCVISEFACGSGGSASGELFRNRDSQARWVAAMFDEFADREANAYLSNIVGAVWFSCDDVSSGKITNCLCLYDELQETLAAFREGFEKLERQ